jgi:hypothetical protein
MQKLSLDARAREHLEALEDSAAVLSVAKSG